MVELRSDQPSKMTPKNILVAYKADLQRAHENNSTSELIWLGNGQRSWLQNVSHGNNGQKPQMKEAVWTQRRQKRGLEHLFAVFATVTCI